MKEKPFLHAQKNASERSPQAQQAEIRKPFQEPILTRHETLVQNTHIGSAGVAGAIGGGFAGL